MELAVVGEAPPQPETPTLPDIEHAAKLSLKRTTERTAERKAKRCKAPKLSNIIDQNLDGDVEMMTQEEVQEAFEEWRRLNGGYPAADAEPTAEQMSALRTVTDDDGPPTVTSRLGATGTIARRGSPNSLVCALAGTGCGTQPSWQHRRT